MYSPKSCDTFAVLANGTADKSIIFGKNSDRPGSEVQEVVYFPSRNHEVPCKLKCTYIEIDQVPHTYAVVLSKPSWMWGAEMGANEYGVCVGNEAVWTKLNDSSDSMEKLLGMDLLRLALERANTAVDALKVIVSLIDTYGMGGNCSNTIPNFTYHNSFLIADSSEVWILECAGALWAAEKVTTTVRNISNELSIGSKIDLMCDNLLEFATKNKFWHPDEGSFDFKKAFGLDEDELESYRYKCGKSLLTQYSKDCQFKETDMFKVLRDKPSGICMPSGSFVSTGSQVSVIQKDAPSCHWFTATPDPSISFFKPFMFTDGIDFPRQVVSSLEGDLKHDLYKSHERFLRRKSMSTAVMRNKIKEFEEKYLSVVKEIAKDFPSRKADASKLFQIAVQDELEIYS